MSLKDVLRPKTKKQLAQATLDKILESKKELYSKCIITELFEENTFGEKFDQEVQGIMNQTGISNKHTIFASPQSTSFDLHKLLSLFLEDEISEFEEIKGTLDWDWFISKDKKLFIAKMKNDGEIEAVVFDYPAMIDQLKGRTQEEESER